MPRVKPFEKYSMEYDRWFVKNHEVYQAEVEILKSLTPCGKNGLEIGVGTGRFANPLNINIGIDPSRKMLSIARERGVEVLLAVAEYLPFKKECFDFVLMVTTICFVDDLHKSLKEAYRVLKKEGHIILGFVDRESELGREYSLRKEKSKFYGDAVFYSAEEVIMLLKTSGFDVDAVKQTLFSDKEEWKNIREGFGEGSFVVIKATKKNTGRKK